MSITKDKIKLIVIITSITAVCLIPVIMFLSFIWPQNIKSINEDMKEILIDRYELKLPDSTEFIKGYYDNSMQDNSIRLAFSVNESDFENMFSENWEQKYYNYQSNSRKSEFRDLTKKEIIGGYIFNGELYTYLYFTESENGKIICCFNGRHPG